MHPEWHPSCQRAAMEVPGQDERNPPNFLTTTAVIHGESRSERKAILLSESGQRNSVWLRKCDGASISKTTHRMCIRRNIDGVVMEQHFNRTRLHVLPRSHSRSDVKMLVQTTQTAGQRHVGMFRSPIQVETKYCTGNVGRVEGGSTARRIDVDSEEENDIQLVPIQRDALERAIRVRRKAMKRVNNRSGTRKRRRTMVTLE